MTQKKTYVLDTTVLIDNPDVIYELGANEVVIPGAVIREIDGLKRNDRPAVAEAARKVARELDRLGSRGDLRKGVDLVTTGALKVVTDYDHVDELDSEGDNRVVGTAVRLAREGKDVELLTTDANMRTVARVHGVKAKFHACGSNAKRIRCPDSFDDENKKLILIGVALFVIAIVSVTISIYLRVELPILGLLPLFIYINYLIKGHKKLRISRKKRDVYIPPDSYLYGIEDE